MIRGADSPIPGGSFFAESGTIWVHDWPMDRVDEAIGGLQSVVRTAPPNRAVGK